MKKVLVGGDEDGDSRQSCFRKDQAIVDFLVRQEAFAMKAQAKLLGYPVLNGSQVERLNFPQKKLGQRGCGQTPLRGGSMFMEIMGLKKNRRPHLEKITFLLKCFPKTMGAVRSGGQIEQQVSVESQPLPEICHKPRPWPF